MGKTVDVIVVGEVNIDLILWDIPMPENEKEKLAKDMNFAMGGSSAITAHNLSAIGSKVAFNDSNYLKIKLDNLLANA